MSNQRYVVGGSDGWLNVKREPSGMVIAIPEYLKVELMNTQPDQDNQREYFVVKEGVERSNTFSVKNGNFNKGTPNGGYRGPAQIEFSLGKKELIFNNNKINAFTLMNNPISIGKHPIQIPDFPHASGSLYTSQTPFSKSWFYLGHGHAISGNNDRYLHPGRFSDGCITIEPSQWTILYQYLILCRSGNGTTVGSVSVVR